MKIQIRNRLIPLAAAMVVVFAAPARADQTAIAFDTTKWWGMYGGAGVFGWQFTAQSDIQISALGLYDNPGVYGSGFPGDGLVEGHAIGIWDVSHPLSPLLSALIPAGTAAPLLSGFRYVTTAPVTLSAGGDYVVGALYSNIDPKDLTTGAVNNSAFALTVSPAIEFGGYRWNNSSTLAFPNGYEPGELLDFGPNFRFTVVPEPSSLAFFGLAAVVLFGLSKKQVIGSAILPGHGSTGELSLI